MKRITIKELATETAKLLGESLLLECQPEESPFPTLEDQVRILSPELLSSLILESPLEMLRDAGKEIVSTPSIDADGGVTLECPEDFLRLIYLKMSDWRVAVTKITPLSSSLLSRQGSKWNGIRGNGDKPLAILLPTGLKLYSSSQGASLERGIYVARPKIKEDDSLEIPDGLYFPLLQKIAEGLK